MTLPIRLATVLFLATRAAIPAAAQTPYKFVSGSGTVAFGVQVGTYKAELDGKGLDVYCVDFLNHVAPRDAYLVNVTKLNGISSLSKTRFGSRFGLSMYQQAAWLAAQFKTTATSQWGYIHAAIWHLTTPTRPYITLTSDVAKVDGWLAQAAANYGKFVYNNVVVLTDEAVAACANLRSSNSPWNGCGRQEHISIGGDLVLAPEPATMALVATGLVGLGGASFMRRHRSSKT